MSAHLSAGQIKARLDHPIIDADGHWIEYGPVFIEELRRVAGGDAVEGWNAVRNGTRGALSIDGSMAGRNRPADFNPTSIGMPGRHHWDARRWPEEGRGGRTP